MSEYQDPLKPFYELYFELKKHFPGCCEEYYHRHIQEKLGYECPHPFGLLRVGGPNGYYYASATMEVADAYDHTLYLGTQLVYWKPSLWCPCCQKFPWNDEKNESRGIKASTTTTTTTTTTTEEIIEKEPILSTFQETDGVPPAVDALAMTEKVGSEEAIVPEFKVPEFKIPEFKFPEITPAEEAEHSNDPEDEVDDEADAEADDEADAEADAEAEMIRKHFDQEIAAEDAKWAEENAKRLIRKKKKVEMITLAKTIPLKTPRRKV